MTECASVKDRDGFTAEATPWESPVVLRNRGKCTASAVPLIP